MKIYDLSMTYDNCDPFPYGTDEKMTWGYNATHENPGIQVSVFTMTTHFGTHIDAPMHYIKDGATTETMPLEAYVGPAVCFEIDVKANLDADGSIDLDGFLAERSADIKPGDKLLLKCGYEELVGKPEYFMFPSFAPNTGEIFERYGITGIGFDMPSIELGFGGAHREVLSRGIGIYESLVGLEDLVGKRFFFSAAPLKFAAGDGSPVRAYAIVENE